MHHPSTKTTGLSQKIALIGVFVLGLAALVLLWQNRSVDQAALAGHVTLVGQLSQRGDYFTLDVKKPAAETWYVANSQDPKLSPLLTPLVGKRTRLAGNRLGADGSILTVTEVNGREVLSTTEAAAFFETPTFEEFYLGLTDTQKSCIEQLLGFDQVNDLIAKQTVGIPSEKIAAINQCLAGS